MQAKKLFAGIIMVITVIVLVSEVNGYLDSCALCNEGSSCLKCGGLYGPWSWECNQCPSCDNNLCIFDYTRLPGICGHCEMPVECYPYADPYGPYWETCYDNTYTYSDCDTCIANSGLGSPRESFTFSPIPTCTSKDGETIHDQFGVSSDKECCPATARPCSNKVTGACSAEGSCPSCSGTSNWELGCDDTVGFCCDTPTSFCVPEGKAVLVKNENPYLNEICHALPLEICGDPTDDKECVWDPFSGCIASPTLICNYTGKNKCAGCSIDGDCGVGKKCCNGECYDPTSKVCCGPTGDGVDCREAMGYGPGKTPCDACFTGVCTTKCVLKDPFNPWSQVPAGPEGFDRPPVCSDIGSIPSISGSKYMDIKDFGDILGDEQMELNSLKLLKLKFIRPSDGYTFSVPLLGPTTLCPSIDQKYVGAQLSTKTGIPGIYTFGEFGITQVHRFFSELVGTGKYEITGYETVTVTIYGQTYTYLIPIWAEKMNMIENTIISYPYYVGLGFGFGDDKELCGYLKALTLLGECSGSVIEGGIEKCFGKNVIRVSGQYYTGDWAWDDEWTVGIEGMFPF